MLALFLLTGCMNGVDQSDPIPELDTASLARAISRFELTFKVRVSTTITFNKLPYKGTVASCLLQTNHISINQELWEDVAPKTRESIVFHELGHCMLGLGHSQERTIMSSFLGFAAISYVHHFEESIAHMVQSPCEFVCDLIQERVSNF